MWRQAGEMVIAAVLLGSVVAAQPVKPIQGTDHIILDDVKIPHGTVITIEGRSYNERRSRFNFAPASLTAMKVDGKATQCDLEVQLVTTGEANHPTPEDLRRFKSGECYEVRGRLANARFNGTQNVCVVEVISFKSIPQIVLTCRDFVDRDVVFEGTAGPAGKLLRADEAIRIDGVKAWPESVQGKAIMVRGKLRRAETDWRLERATWTFLELEDQVGQTVSLEGSLWSLNGHWWFAYRGKRLYLTMPAGPVMTFRSDDHGRPIRVTGLLLQQLRPALNQISLKTDRDLVRTFVVRGTRFEFLDDRASWGERFGVVYSEPNRVEDGVPLLVPEVSVRLNLFGNETRAQLVMERNRPAITAILGKVTPESLDVLNRRMNDSKTDETLRLIYAAMLASANDDRGREFLLKFAKPKDGVLDLNALYCLGIVPFLGPEEFRLKTRMDWAEPTLIHSLNDTTSVTTVGGVMRDTSRQTVSEAAMQFTSIPVALARSGSKAGREALLKLALTDRRASSRIIPLVCGLETPPTIEELLQLEEVSEESSDRRQILSAILDSKAPKGLDRFLDDFVSGFVYMDLRAHLRPEVLAQLRPLVDKAEGKSKTQIQTLLILGERDPIPGLIACLEDPEWTDKNLVLFELARLADPRAVPVIGKILRTSPGNFFQQNLDPAFQATNAIEHGLNAMARTGTAEAIQELILLLQVDLARFGSYIDRAGLQRIVAAHLIELTGESFGVDFAGWQKWKDDHPMHSVKRELLNSDESFRVNENGVIDFGQ
jgi:hypothetical protein